MAFGVDPFNEVDDLWWEVVSEDKDCKLLRMERAITYEELQEHGFDMSPNDPVPMIMWLKNSFAWHAFRYYEENYVQRIGLMHEPDEDVCFHPVIWIDPEW